MSDSKDLKRKIVKLISSVYSQWNVEMMKDTYKSNVKCQLFLKKLKDVYDLPHSLTLCQARTRNTMSSLHLLRASWGSEGNVSGTRDIDLILRSGVT
jgi:hypothetical protein